MNAFRRRLVRVVGVAMSAAVTVAGVAWAAPGFGVQGALAADRGAASAVVGSFSVGGAQVDVDERTGRVRSDFALASLAGLGEGVGGVELAVSYSQEHVGAGDGWGLGSAWSWGVTSVDVSGDVPRVFPASGGVFEADGGARSGLARYPLEDLVFRQVPGVLDVPTGREVAGVEYGFVLEAMGGGVEYFNASGRLIARADRFGNTTRWVWDEKGRLQRVIDAAGNTVVVEWVEAGVRIHTPKRADGVTPPPVEITTRAQGVAEIVDPASETTTFGYDVSGLLSEVRSSAGAVTRVEYDERGPVTTVGAVTVFDEQGRELSRKLWTPEGEALFTGFPVHAGEAALWGSGDGAFRYRTRVSDGYTSVVCTYNAMGLLVERALQVSTSVDTRVVQEERFVYPGTREGGVPSPRNVPANYALPVESTTVFRDGDRTRTVSEQSVYDAAGRVVSRTDALGAVTTSMYDDMPVTSLGLPIGLLTLETVTGVDGLVGKTINTLSTDRRSVAGTEVLTGTVGELASVNRSGFVTDAQGFVTERTVSSSPDAEASSGPDQVTTRFAREVDVASQTTTVTETSAAGTDVESVTRVTSDLSTGSALQSVDATGRVTVTGYDQANRPVAVTDPAGRVTTTQYKNHGLVSAVRGPDGVVSSTYTDVLGRVVKVTSNVTSGADGSPVVSQDPGFERVTETREYTGNGSRVRVVDALGRQSEHVTDVFGRPLVASLENGLSQVSVYDDVENAVTTGVTPTPGAGLAGAVQTSTRYLDAAGRDREVVGARADGVRVPLVANVFDGLGRTRESTQQDVTSSAVFNADGTARATTLTPDRRSDFPGESVTAERSFDMTGTATQKTMTSVGGGRAEGVSRVVDEHGRTVMVTDQAGGVTRTSYAADGLVTSTVHEASGTVTHNSYDAVTRLLTEQVTMRAGVESVRELYEYDPVTDRVRAVFDPADRVGTEVSYGYDVLGNVTSVAYPDGKVISHVFDVNGRKVATTDVLGNTTRYEYSALGLLARAVQTSPVGNIVAEVSYEHDVLGRVTRVTCGNGASTVYSFTSANEIKTERTVDRDGRTIFDGAYEYDAHGNLVSKTVTGQHAGAADLVSETVTYTYDAYNQLIGSRVVSGGLQDESEAWPAPARESVYEVGVAGNVTNETVVAGGVPTVRELENNALGQTIAVTTNGVRAVQEYDAAGNLVVAADGSRFAYDARNQHVSVTSPDGASRSFDYWVTGKRKNQSDGAGAQTGFYWDGDVLANETYGDGAGSSYLFGVNRAARSIMPADGTAARSEVVEYYVADRHGSTVALTSQDGDVSTSYEYTDYGQATTHADAQHGDTTSNRFQYAGEYTERDARSQLLGARTYNPAAFAFTTRDTAPLFNLYAYGNANPITKTDPTGRTSIEDIQANGIMAGIGVLFSLIALASPIVAGVAPYVPLMGAIAVAGAFGLGVATAQGVNALHESQTGKPVFDDRGKETLRLLAPVALAFGVVAGAGGLFHAGFGRIVQTSQDVEQTLGILNKLEHGSSWLAFRGMKGKNVVGELPDEMLDHIQSFMALKPQNGATRASRIHNTKSDLANARRAEDGRADATGLIVTSVLANVCGSIGSGAVLSATTPKDVAYTGGMWSGMLIGAASGRIASIPFPIGVRGTVAAASFSAVAGFFLSLGGIVAGRHGAF